MSRSYRSGADGVVAHNATWLVSDHPVRSKESGFASLFLMSRPPLLREEGNIAHPTNSFTPS